jgi:hypothetical protein
MKRITLQGKDGWLRVKFILGVEDDKIVEVEYTASRCKTLRSLADTLKDALVGVYVGRIREAVRKALSGVDLPENRENRRRLLFRTFGIEDG